VDRAGLVLAQTPQVFRVELIRSALARDRAATDEVQLLETSGHPVLVVEGDPRNFKITFPADLALAEALLGSHPGRDPGPRVGVGYDVHELVAGRRLVLGGVVLPFELGLLGHSDADVLCHAIGDALLGASALGDLGTHFPPGDPSTEGISSLELLRQIAALLAGAGLRIGNLDATVVCERPRLAPHLQAMRVELGVALGLDPARIGIKATTSERLGFTGRGEGIAAVATALLFPL
jgi:2-C-methyl-D-erythritol 4-phosphate cytidylyltransferase/2-C-methyl-D-erythritol 2,4-cyclodiphosphate synthase